jgi:hypothetical protein
MKSIPRPTLSLRAIVTLALASSLLLLSASAPAQQRTRAKSAPTTTQSKNSERARRAVAALLLNETAYKARSFDDLFYRARIQMLAADALWPYDSVQARTIFRRAWEAAAASDKADREETARGAGALPVSIPKVTDARDEVLAKAATRDARLAESFLRDLASDRDDASANSKEPSRRTAWRDLSSNGSQRLALASALIEAGEIRRAAEVAAPLVNEGVRAELMAFIRRLRDKSVSDADALYLRLLGHAAADPLTDSNDLLLLSSPFVSPTLLVVVDEFGALQFRVLPPTKISAAQLAQLTPKTWAAFFNLAASVLSRPLRPNNDSLTMQELVARFYVTGRLLPFFEDSAAPHSVYAPTLRARQSELFNELEASRREQLTSQLGVNSLTPSGYVDPLRTQTDELAQMTDPAERSSLALSIVRTAVRHRFWDRARRAAAEIDDAERRQIALTYIQVHQIKDILRAYEDQKEDDYESVAKFVRGADVPPFAKAWGLAQAATIAARKREARTPQNISELINEAESYAARVAQGTPERVAAYAVVTTAAAPLDATRAWELLRETVKAANEVKDFTGDNIALSLWADGNPAEVAAEDFEIEAEAFRLDEIFATMAHLDFDKAMAEARALDGDVPQALAIIMVAKSRIQEPGVRSQKKN